ncbi:MAG: phosphodiester glycosidase family protein [Erysipelotrichaceae bacterium]|nr:phosphodiester glycosidase family protein [Erysipelotrichaceae bacterium]
MKSKIRTYGSATVYIYIFDIDEEEIEPELHICGDSGRKTLSEFVSSIPDGREPVIAINGGVFNANTSSTTPLYHAIVNGAERGNGYDNPQVAEILYTVDQKYEMFVPDDEDRSSSYYNWIRSGFYNLISNGTDATGFNTSIPEFNSYNKKMAIGTDATKTKIIIIGTAQGVLSGQEMRQLMLDEGAFNAVGLDGGQSTTLSLYGKNVIKSYLGGVSERPITDAIVFTRSTANNTSGYILRAKSNQFAIREHVVNGNIKKIVPLGGYADILQFIPGFQTDGFQWARVKHTLGSEITYGYAQLDNTSQYNMINKSSNSASTIYLKATNDSFRIRTSPVTGTTLKIVYTGEKVRIKTFATGYASDGYQWALVEYRENGQTHEGWSQVDLNNYYTIVTH